MELKRKSQRGAGGVRGCGGAAGSPFTRVKRGPLSRYRVTRRNAPVRHLTAARGGRPSIVGELPRMHELPRPTIGIILDHPRPRLDRLRDQSGRMKWAQTRRLTNRARPIAGRAHAQLSYFHFLFAVPETKGNCQYIERLCVQGDKNKSSRFDAAIPYSLGEHEIVN
ncbi:hypothetical protein EVAR_96666_1 [Eumeta japonica]|uniref:Uncharacterized protein n=1 Tax=Eumeta variegata TaxID=151549 RepID=A0A4C1WHT3_EUMVA|nr:hypothetical protein EVAR_96666_1 [Eumeta japonica]